MLTPGSHPRFFFFFSSLAFILSHLCCVSELNEQGNTFLKELRRESQTAEVILLI